MVAVVPVPVPVVGDPEGDGLVVARAQVLDDLRVGRLAAGPGVFAGQVGLAEDDDHLFCPGLEAAGAELGDRAAASYDVGRALLDAGEVTEHLLVGGVPVGDQDAGEEREDRGDRRGAPRAHGPQPGQFPARRADDQHVRRALDARERDCRPASDCGQPAWLVVAGPGVSGFRPAPGAGCGA